MFADLHKTASLSESSLPSVAKVLDLGDEPIVLHMEAKLPKLVPLQAELLAGSPGRHRLQSRGYLGHVVRLPVFAVDDDALSLSKMQRLAPSKLLAWHSAEYGHNQSVSYLVIKYSY